jgi:DNA-binding MarR family transcriptional regulator
MELIRVVGVLHPDQVVRGHPVSVSQAFAIHQLDTEPPPSQQELAEQLRLEKSTISRLVAQLERQGLVQRERHPDQPRRYRLRLTAAGRDRHAQIAAGFHQRYVRWIAAMAPADRDALLTGLAALLHAIHADHPVRSGPAPGG